MKKTNFTKQVTNNAQVIISKDIFGQILLQNYKDIFKNIANKEAKNYLRFKLIQEDNAELHLQVFIKIESIWPNPFIQTVYKYKNKVAQDVQDMLDIENIHISVFIDKVDFRKD